MLPASERVRAYSWFALFVLTLASVFNFADRAAYGVFASARSAAYAALVCVIVGAGGGPNWVGKLSVLRFIVMRETAH